MRHAFSFLFRLLPVLFGFLPGLSWSYSEMVRNGYANCAACHYSNSGGGLLTPYGRQLSRELLSTRGRDGEEAFLYGLVRSPDWLALGGNVRRVWQKRTVYAGPQKTEVQTKGSILMQADVEAAISLHGVTVAGTLGREEGGETYASRKNDLFSRRHYIKVNPAEALTLRAGLFQKEFGLNIPEHAIGIKRGLRFDEGSETYNLEVSWFDETISLSASAALLEPEAPELFHERGVTMNGGYFFNDRYKAGLSFYRGQSDVDQRVIAGGWGVFGFTTRLYLMSEVDLQYLDPESPFQRSGWGFVDYQKLGFELYKGIHLIATQEMSRRAFSDPQSVSTAYGGGLQLFPRPHFDIQIFAESYSQPGTKKAGSWYWAMLQNYL